MSFPQPWRAAAFAEKRVVASILACGGSGSHVASPMSGRFSNAEYPLRSGLWHPLNIPLPRALPGRNLAELGFLVPSKLPQGSLEPRHSAPSKRELQHGFGPAGCAVLLQARFDECLDCCPSGDLGGEEGCAADRAFAMLEPPLGGGSGERHGQRMPEPCRRDPLDFS